MGIKQAQSNRLTLVIDAQSRRAISARPSGGHDCGVSLDIGTRDIDLLLVHSCRHRDTNVPTFGIDEFGTFCQTGSPLATHLAFLRCFPAGTGTPIAPYSAMTGGAIVDETARDSPPLVLETIDVDSLLVADSLG